MAFDFPAAPALDDGYEPTDGPKYWWNGIAWRLQPRTTSAVPPPLPIIASLAPDYATAGLPTPVTVKVLGSNFQAGSIVELDGAATASSFVSAGELTFSYTAPVGARTVQVTVRNPEGASNASPLEVVLHRLSGITPNVVPIGTPSPVVITCNGSGFTAASQIMFNNNPLASVFVSQTTLTFDYVVPTTMTNSNVRVVTDGQSTLVAGLSTM